MKILMIVESPAKAAIIKKYLEQVDPENKYTVKASFGHVRDLKEKELGINVDGDFEPTYTVLTGKQKVVTELVSQSKLHDMVYLASDCDREGESISWHVREILPRTTVYKRVTFNEITPTALKHAVDNPRSIDMDLVNAQQARRFIDRIVGFKLSPLLWKHYKTAAGTVLSAGRVQSVALKIVIDREREVESHKSESYWNIQGNFKLKPNIELNGAKLYYKKGDASSENCQVVGNY